MIKNETFNGLTDEYNLLRNLIDVVQKLGGGGTKSVVVLMSSVNLFDLFEHFFDRIFERSTSFASPHVLGVDPGFYFGVIGGVHR